jgi:hypothetical protein
MQRLFNEGCESLAAYQVTGAVGPSHSSDADLLWQLGGAARSVKDAVRQIAADRSCPMAPSTSTLGLPPCDNVHQTLRDYMEAWKSSEDSSDTLSSNESDG